MRKNSAPPQEIRIIAGKHRGRKIPVLTLDGLRPSPNRVRETLFNWLQFEISGMHVLDAFAGSGALGLEALSRGADSALFLDRNPSALTNIQTCLSQWRETHARTQCGDALSISASTTRYDLIFLDPPFADNLHHAVLTKFAQDNWLKPHGKLYLEYPSNLELTLPEGWHWAKHSHAGQIRFGLLERSAS